MIARLVSVVIPTFRRPYGFVRAVRSVFAQRGSRCAIELICVDNDPEGSAGALMRTLSQEAPFTFRFAHAPQPGVANARNAAMRLVQGDAVAFLDDDEEAGPSWLGELLGVARQTGADAVFGPVEAVIPDAIRRHRTYFERVWSRRRAGPSGLIDRYYGMGNSLVSRAGLLTGSDPFDLSANQRGGEDDILFSRAAARGARFAWAAEARVKEFVPGERATLRYTLRRSFAYGQGPCETAWMQQPRDFAGLIRHMGVGALQLGVYAPAAALAWTIGADARAELTDRAASGLGKLLWWSPQRFYGAPAPKPRARRSSRAMAGSASV